MGVLSDLLSGASRLDSTDPKLAPDNHVYNELSERTDFGYPAGMAEADEVQSIAVYDGSVSGGTFTLTFTLENGESFTTAGINHNANAATIEAAIDTAADGEVTGWTDEDISVSGGDLTSAPVVLTFDGDSVAAQNHALVTIDGGSLTGGGTAGEITQTTPGRPDRTALAALIGMGVLDVDSVSAPEYKAAATSWTQRSRNEIENYPSPGTISYLVEEYYHQEQNEDSYELLKATLNTGVARAPR